MKKTLASILSIYLCFAHITGFSQKKIQVSRVKIHISHQQLNKIKAAGIEFDHGYYDFNNNIFENEFSSVDIAKLKQLGYRIDVIVADVMAYTDSLNRVEDPMKYANQPVGVGNAYRSLRLNFTTTQNFEASIPTPTTFTLGSMGGFYNLTELNNIFDNMVSSYPTFVTKISIGNTLQGRPMYAIKISDNASTDEAEPEVLYTGMHHSREGMSMMNLIFYMRFLLENYTTNPAIKDIIDSRELFFIPVTNVDGFNYNTTTTNWNANRRMRRKNMAETTTAAINADGSGGDGVDINRNYPTYWGSGFSNGNTASSATGSADSYRGPSANSEPETVNMMNFVNGRNFTVALNYHCYGNWWIRPQGPDVAVYPTVGLPAAAVATYNSIASLFTKYNCYVYGTPNQTVYDVNGYSDDWLFSDPSHSPIYSFSPEIGNSGDGFWCPQAKIIPYAKETIFPNLQAAYTAGGYAELHDTSDIVLTATTGSFNYMVTRKGLADSPVVVSIIPLNNIQSVGGSSTVSSIASFGGQASGSISYVLPSGIANGSPVRFVWVMQTGGIIIKDTVLKYYNPVVVFADSMNVSADFASKWVVAGTGSNWAYEAATGVAGTASLTESPSANYTNSADHSIKLSSPLNLSTAMQAGLSFMLKYASENCQDRLQVEISTNGVNGTYTPIVTDYTVTENRGSLGNAPAITGSSDGWVREGIDLTPYAGNTNVGLRFRFLSGAGNGAAYSTDGFQIDNLKVVKSSTIVLPVNFDDIKATRLNDAVLVTWKATTDENFNSYHVQRSIDAIHFETIAILNDANASSFPDVKPHTGTNYYRIQASLKNNSIKNSKTVWVVFASKSFFNLYPNPVSKQLNVEVYNEENQQTIMEIHNANGIKCYRADVSIKKGMNLFKVNTYAFLSQVYILTFKSSGGKILYSKRFIKTVEN